MSTGAREMPVDLYCNVIAPFCRAVMLLAKALDIEMNLIDVNVLKREQYKPEFLAVRAVLFDC